MEQSLQHERQAAYAHHKEGGQGNAIGITCADSSNCLRQVSQYHANGGNIATNLKYYTLFHKIVV
jgi:hypothetical protein